MLEYEDCTQLLISLLDDREMKQVLLSAEAIAASEKGKFGPGRNCTCHAQKELQLAVETPCHPVETPCHLHGPSRRLMASSGQLRVPLGLHVTGLASR